MKIEVNYKYTMRGVIDFNIDIDEHTFYTTVDDATDSICKCLKHFKKNPTNGAIHVTVFGDNPDDKEITVSVFCDSVIDAENGVVSHKISHGFCNQGEEKSIALSKVKKLFQDFLKENFKEQDIVA